MAEQKKISRRKFLIRSGLGGIGVLALGTYIARNPLRRGILNAVEKGILPYSGKGTEAALWFELTYENKLIFHSPKVEMGQGIFTAFTQIIAEEMDLLPSQIEVKAAATDTGIIDAMSTGGSLSVAQLWGPLRELSSTMREMIKNEAAAKMGVDISALKTLEGIVSNGSQSRTYAEVAAGVKEWKIPDDVPVPKTKDFKYIGRPMPRVDLKEKVFGSPIYGLDAQMPDMLYASVIRPGIVGAKFKSADTKIALDMPGVVKVVQIDNWVGVIAKSFAEALAAKDTIKVEWLYDKLWTEEEMRKTLSVGMGDSFMAQKEGKKLADDDDEVQTMEFTSPIGAHAQIEPNGALAYYNEGKVTVILSTQVIGVTQKQIAKALDMELEDINVIPTHLGGGFGRRLDTNHAIQAVQLSREVGKPVKYVFTRKEEFQNDQFRPPTHHIVKGKLGSDLYLESLEHHYASGDVSINSAIQPPIVKTVFGTDLGAGRGAKIMYDGIENCRSVQWHTTLPFATSWWRALGLLANTFAIESFIDEMALEASKNPIEFRLNKLSDEGNSLRLKKVIQMAADKGNYEDVVKNGRAKGFAASMDNNSIAAHVVELSIEKGQIKVHKVFCVFDCGKVINPDQVRAQCEGAIIMGMSAAVYEKMTLEKGELTPTIYGPYEMVRMKHAPKEIEVHLIEGRDIPLPVGEPPLGPIGAAIGNAIRRLTGIRLKDMPLQEALDKVYSKNMTDIG
ncbi:xanthine dehydrogenase family protein molybdopterin-binding subunit [Hyphobacterium sp. CCMP332]|nr:xanthine dehydrogenase family protein molybdopterin-binding subunit [Hyphobacterium sp. CCMP332]